jgi:hypothetical protein
VTKDAAQRRSWTFYKAINHNCSRIVNQQGVFVIPFEPATLKIGDVLWGDGQLEPL